MIDTTADNRWPLLASKDTVAKMFDTSARNVDLKIAAGTFPAAVRMGGVGAPRWRLCELEAWIHAGCPAIDGWQWPSEVDAE